MADISFDSLPYIDAPLTPEQRSAILASLTSAIPPSTLSTPHTSLAPLPESNLTPIAQSEQARVAAGTPISGIDTSRYESPDAPSSASPTSSLLAAYNSAATTSTHLSVRAQNLELLEKWGKNAWLIHNSQLESELKRVEKELESTKKEVEDVNKERKGMQEGLRGELEGLEQTWRSGVGRLVGVLVEGEKMRGEILDARRSGA